MDIEKADSNIKHSGIEEIIKIDYHQDYHSILLG